jgi:signal transduction histidine kinase/ligand-binding sensor domain-containing protein/DNA-binding response OmpR family regulator
MILLTKIENSLLILCLITSIFISDLFSQSILFNSLSVKGGLSNNKVISILQDKTGFLWFGTEDGLNRFDGYEFKVFRNNPADSNSISGNNIWSLFEDGEGNIWIGTKSGELNRYDAKKDIFEHWKIESKNYKENSINEIYRDKEGIIWIGTYQSGLYRFNIETNKLDNWNYKPGDPHSLSNNFVTFIAEDSDGYLWISTYNGLNKFNPKSNDDSFLQFYSDSENTSTLSSNLIWSITKSKYDPELMWIGTASGLVSLDTKKQIFSRIPITKENSLQFGNSFASVVEEKNNNENVLWLGTYGGLVRLNMKNGESQRFIKRENEPSSIISNEINKLIKDRSGVIWIATENGLSYISPKGMKFNSLFDEQKKSEELKDLSKINVKAISQHSNGKLFFGTSKGVYGYTNSSNKHIIQKYKSTDGINVWSMADGSNDDLWIGTYGQGLKQLNLKDGNLKNWLIESPTFKTSAYDYLKSLCLDNNNDLWIGFWGGGLGRMNTKNGKYNIWIHDDDNPNSISHNDVWAIHQDRNGRIWIGTNGGGLNLFDNKNGGEFHKFIEVKDQEKKLSSNSIYSICESTKGKYSNNFDQTILWIGTSSGLNKLIINNTSELLNINSLDFKVFIYKTENGLADNSIKSILEDENGNLWIGTNSGISFFDIESNKFINYSSPDGLIENEFNSGSALSSEEGLMYFGSIEGLNVFDPKQIKQSVFIPAVVLTDFQIFNQPVKVGNESPLKENINEAKAIILSHSENVFSFQFSALDFNSPQSIQYAYIMDGFDADWIYSGNRRFVTYTNLDPGKYTFKVKATNSDGIWSEDFKSILVIVNSPWWRTGWAYAFYVLLIVVGIFTARKIERNRSALRNELKMREFEAKKQRELENMKARFFANLSHEFRTPLTLIRGPIEELINKKAGDNEEEYYQLIQRNSEKLQELIDQLLELTQLENASIPLKAKQENIVSLMRGLLYSFESLAKQKNITLSFHSQNDRLISWVDRDKLEKIINNLLSNAFKFTSSNGVISVGINHTSNNDEEFAEVLISDTGIGIPKEKQERIFDRFYQVDDSSRKNYGGSGIGLALVKELVDLHKWEINVDSELGKGTEFNLKIPLWDSYLNGNEKVSEAITDKLIGETYKHEKESAEDSDLFEKEIEQEIIEKKKLLGDKPSILIVEDSEDVRSYLNSLLKSDYRIYEAVNGEDGVKKTSELIPDLIISDVMMPSMNGMEFCKKVKTDWLTSHIPVILLTAKASAQSKIEGLETGADAYLTKPFNSNELSVRIRNLLEQRKMLREKFSKEIKVEPASIAVTSLDNEFLQKAFDVAEKNLSNTEFNSEAFAKEMFVSRSQLHRKLLAITSQAPGEFLRTFRLKRAATFILEKRLSITQVAFEVGFSSPSHFTKAFRQQFNCLPTEFIEKNNS